MQDGTANPLLIRRFAGRHGSMMQHDAPALRRFEVDVGGQYVGFLPAGFVGCFYFFDQAVYCAKQVVGHVQMTGADMDGAALKNQLP